MTSDSVFDLQGSMLPYLFSRPNGMEYLLHSRWPQMVTCKSYIRLWYILDYLLQNFLLYFFGSLTSTSNYLLRHGSYRCYFLVCLCVYCSNTLSDLTFWIVNIAHHVFMNIMLSAVCDQVLYTFIVILEAIFNKYKKLNSLNTVLEAKSHF